MSLPKFEAEWVLTHQNMNTFLRALQGDIVQTLLNVTQQDTPALGVKVGSGDGVIQGNYHSKYQATNVSIATPDATYPRKDLVCMKSDGTLVSSGVDNACKGVAEPANPSDKTGPKTKEPKAPDIPSGYLLLAEVWVPAGATSILNANVTDRRVLGPQHFPFNMGDVHNQCDFATNAGYMREGYMYFQLHAKMRFHTGFTQVGRNDFVACWDTQLLWGYGVYQWSLKMLNWEINKILCSGLWWHYRCGLQGLYFLRQINGNRLSDTGQDGYIQQETVTGWDEAIESTMKMEWTPSSVKFYVGGALKTTHTTYVPYEPVHLGMEIGHEPKDTDYAGNSEIWIKDWERIA